jgi:alkanesulfonate monooxygenase
VPAQELVAAHGDVWFINGQPLENVQGLIESVRTRERAGAALRFGLSAFVITRETAAAAQDAYEHLLALSFISRSWIISTLSGNSRYIWSTFSTGW